MVFNRFGFQTFVMIAVLTVFQASASAQTVLRFQSTADATVMAKYPTRNYGTASTVEADNSPLTQAYLMFAVSGSSSQIASAKVRLYVVNSSSNGPAIYQTSVSWSESSINWNNKPAAISGALDNKGSVHSGNYVEYDVSSVVKGDGIFGFVLKADSNDGMDVSSKEGRYKPELVVTLTSSTPTPTPTPNPTPAPTPSPTPSPTPAPSVSDDTFSTLNRAGAKVVLSGDYGYNQYKLSSGAANTTVDARAASFIVANSKNSDPVSTNTCDFGTLPINLYPISLKSTPGVGLVGGIVNGLVPQLSDWAYTYCNSASVNVQGSPGAIVDGARVDRSWDSLRFSSGTLDWTVKDTHLSNSHDDCIENDEGRSGLVKDSLFDGCYMGISMAPGNLETNAVLKIEGLLLRMKAYLANGAVYEASPFKIDDVTTAKISIKDTIIAYDYTNLKSLERTKRAWDRVIECSGNLILWLPDDPMPSGYPTPPSCFQIIKGQAARDLWQKARQNWMNCHPNVAHTSEDVASDPALCDTSFYGGKN